jgi:hypothetical protein
VKHSDVFVIGPSPVKLLRTIGLGGIGVVAGVGFVLDGLFGRNWLLSTGWIVIAMAAGLVVCVCMLALIRRRPNVEIGPHGFIARALFGSRTRRWRDIDGDFAEIKVGFGQAVGYRLTQELRESLGIKPTTLFAGNDEAISGSYEVPIWKLVESLNERKSRPSGLSSKET